MKLSELNEWIDRGVGIAPLDVLRRVVQGNFPRERVDSLGKEWKKLERLFEVLGAYEFEVYLQTQITGEKENIKKRGFYNGILVTDRAEQNYEKHRASVISLWRSPSLRHKHPVFVKLFPIECEFLSEYWGRFTKNPETDHYESSKLFTAEHSATDLWVSCRFERLSSIPEEFENARLLFTQGRGMISVKGWSAPEVLRENMRAQIEACLAEGKKFVGEDFDPEINPEECLDGEVCVNLAPVISSLVGRVSSKFKVAVHSKTDFKPL